MCSTPAPPLTAWVAASIWSGTGDVKTAPGQAASSIPRPTNPPCIGSWPEPPPEITPTLPGRGASRRTTMFGDSTRTRSPCASATPASASSTSRSGELISFFIATPPELLAQLLARQDAPSGWRRLHHQVVGDNRVVDEVGDGGA